MRKQFAKSRKINLFQSIVFLLCIAAFVLGFYFLWNYSFEILTDAVTYFGFTFAIMTVMVGYSQFRANHDWNRRQLAFSAVKEVKEGMNKHIALLDKAFGYNYRKKSSPITIEEIHQKICVTDQDGKCVYKGAKLVLDCEDEEKKNIRKAILHVLNGYEYLAAGIYEGVLDEEIVISLLRGPLLKTYQVFRHYIEHFNTDMHSERKGRIWINLKNFAKELESLEDSEKPRIRPQADV
jgi:hypothetical protein